MGGNTLVLCLWFLVVFCQNVESKFTFKQSMGQLDIYIDNRLILQHSGQYPAVSLGLGHAKYEMHRGNFRISDGVDRRLQMTTFVVEDGHERNLSDSNFLVTFGEKSGKVNFTLEFNDNAAGQSILTVHKLVGGDFNRLWLRLWTNPDEHLYGGGEQFSYFSLRGHAYPMWVREQGVGRNRSTLITWLADTLEQAGGDYYTSYWLQPTFVSDRLYFAHVEYYNYSLVNLTEKNRHELELWGGLRSLKIHFGTASTWPKLLERLTGFIGRQPVLPSWIYEGTILGVQGGTDEVLEKYDMVKSNGVKVCAVWIQDWSGKIFTDLGKRVYWNWMWDPDMYPNLDKVIKEFKQRGVRFLSYINPHVIKNSTLFKEGDDKGYFIKSFTTGTTQLVDFGGFECGTVDLTNPEAYSWYKQVLKNMLDLGFSGWMADFGGEYLPAQDSQYHNGRSATEMHNMYNELWAKVNKEAAIEAGKLEDTFIFMRSGFGMSVGHSMVSWAGDQNVDFSYADGLASVIPSALSLGMSGMGIHHSDVGGYLSALSMVRTEELVLRWAEMNVFTPIMRTHEGNKPDRNWQVYTTKKTAQSFSRITDLFTLLGPYHKHVVEENSKLGYPAQRPLFFHYSDDPRTYDIKFQYLYGRDILVAPVFLEGRRRWQVYLPPDDWVYLWNGSVTSVQAGQHGEGISVEVESLIGNPPVFYRKGTNWESLLQQFKAYKVYREDDSTVFTWDLLWNNPLIFLYLIFRKICWYILLNP